MPQTIDEFLEAAEANPGPAEVIPEAAPEVDEVGQGGAEGSAPTTEATYFDPSEHADKVVKVKVDGEEIEVPLSEALQGYQRQAAFTKKTQALAEQAKQVEAALVLQERLRNPQTASLTIQQLALQALQAQASQQQVERPPDDPIERRLWEQDQRLSRFEQWQEQQAQQEADEALARELGRLQTKYADAGFDPQKVIERAYQEESYDPEGAFLRMVGERALAQQFAAGELAREDAAGDAAASAARNAAAQLMGGGSALGGGAPLEEEELTTREAYLRAVQKHGPLSFG